jgi:hypothetical protein
MLLIVALTICSLLSGMPKNLTVLTANSERIATQEIQCEGNACASVSLTWDETKEQYKAQNNSTDRWVRIEGANLVSNASLCLAPSKSDYLALKTIVAPYRATLAEENCGKKTLGN